VVASRLVLARPPACLQKARALDRYWHGQDYIDPSQVTPGLLQGMFLGWLGVVWGVVATGIDPLQVMQGWC